MMRVIEVTVKPSAKKTEILEEEGNTLIIAVKAPPQDNKANIELLKFLSKKYHCYPTIISGHHNKKKLIRLGAAQMQGD